MEKYSVKVRLNDGEWSGKVQNNDSKLLKNIPESNDEKEFRTNLRDLLLKDSGVTLDSHNVRIVRKWYIVVKPKSDGDESDDENLFDLFKDM